MEKEVKEEFFHWMFATYHRSPSFSLKSTWTESRDRREKKNIIFFVTRHFWVCESLFSNSVPYTHTHLFIALCTKVPISICSCLLPNIELKKWEKKFREKIIFFFFFSFRVWRFVSMTMCIYLEEKIIRRNFLSISNDEKKYLFFFILLTHCVLFIDYWIFSPETRHFFIVFMFSHK